MTAAPAHAPAGPVTGDGTDARSRVRARWRRWRWPLAVLAVVLVGLLVLVALTPRRSETPFDVRNVRDDGARAVTQVLGRQGVTVTQTSSAQDAVRRATHASPHGATLAVVGPAPLGTATLDTLADAPVDLVLVGVDAATVDRLGHGLVSTATTGTVATVPLEAGCAGPDALAAGRIAVHGATVTPDDPAGACFLVPGTDAAAVATVVLDDGRRVTVVGSTDLVTNGAVLREGNAALALRTLGRHGTLVWYLPPAASSDLPAGGPPGLLDLLPGGARALTALAAAVVLAAVLWRARRLGPVVPEALPVEVRAVESTYGRGRLYRRASARGHAAAALRAGAADRMARRVGLPRSTGGPALVDAVARASGRDAALVAALLHGPPPTDDAAFAALVRQLDQLEREVDRS